MFKTIFVVDDSDTNLKVAKEAIESQYRVLTLPSAGKMFGLLKKITPDLILLDIEMPEMTGFEALKQLKSCISYINIPVIFLTGHADAELEAEGFELGAVDFIAKPFSAPVLRNRIKMHLEVDELIRERTRRLEEQARRLERLNNGIVSIMVDMIENRDRDTAGHIDRTTSHIKLLMEAMLERGVYADEMKDCNLDVVSASSRLHDVGKIAIPDMVLNKPGRLDPGEIELMRTHAKVGEMIIDQVIARTEEEDFWNDAKLFAGYHHERWDGEGYPRSLKGTEIPLYGRIMAIVDVYDALVSRRPYKAPFTHEESVNIIMSEAGRHFDPKIAEVFYEINEKLNKAGTEI